MKSDRYAHLRIGDCDIAVPALSVERAIAVPAAGLTALPRREGALSGLVDVGGIAVPVVALDRWVPLGQAGGLAEARIVVLHAGASRIALHVDALVGTVNVDPACVQLVCHASTDEELFEAIVPATSHRPMLCILEVGRLMALTAAWCESAELQPAARATTGSTLRPVATVRLAMFAIGDEHWAVPATALARLAKAPRAELRWPGQRVCGIGTWERRKVPLVDLQPNGATDAGVRPWMAVVVAGALAIGLVVDRFERMLTVTADDIVSVPSDGIRSGTARVAGLGLVSMLDVDSLFDMVPEASISQVAPSASATQRDAGSDANVHALGDDTTHYLVFEADRRYASPVGGVVGVAALAPEAIDDLNAGRRAALTWRGETVGVAAMPSLDGGKPMSDLRVAVILRSQDGKAYSAVAVRGLRDWLSAKAARRSGMQRRDVGALSMITPPGGQRSGSLVVVDLAQMAYLLG